MVSGKELSNSQKALIFKLWKDGENYRKISSKLNISITMISSYTVRFKGRNIVENKKVIKKKKKKKKKSTGAPKKISPRLSRKL